jgi:hypothetical protein
MLDVVTGFALDVAKKVIVSLVAKGVVKGVEKLTEKDEISLENVEPKAVKEYLGKVMKDNGLPTNMAPIFTGYCCMNLDLGTEEFKKLRENEADKYAEKVHAETKNKKKSVEVNLSEAYEEFQKGLPENFTVDNLLDACEYLPGNKKQDNVYTTYLADRIKEYEYKKTSPEAQA